MMSKVTQRVQSRQSNQFQTIQQIHHVADPAMAKVMEQQSDMDEKKLVNRISTL
jgi:hypothetical protein